MNNVTWNTYSGPKFIVVQYHRKEVALLIWKKYSLQWGFFFYITQSSFFMVLYHKGYFPQESMCYFYPM